MTLIYTPRALAGPSATGSNTHTGYNTSGATDDIQVIFRITAVGATPTVTWKVQGAPDETSVADGSANWFDLSVRDVTGTSSTTLVATMTKTATGVYVVAIPEDVQFRRIRLVTSANTNVTYECDLGEFQDD